MLWGSERRSRYRHAVSSYRAPAWVAAFYDRKSQTTGPSGVLDHHRERASTLAALVPEGRVLELGCGAGGAAAAAAQRGLEVTAVELSPVRAGFARALAASHDVAVEVLESDFMTLSLPRHFDAVVMWNGFGVGSDDDQHALLARIATDWLVQGGTCILDVFNPAGWARLAGQEVVDPETGVRQRVEYDVEGARFVDLWFFDGEGSPPLSQSVRCYSPADFRLLAEDLPLSLEVGGWHGDPVDAWGWRAVMRVG